MRSRATVPGEVLMTLVAVLWGSAFPVTRVLLQDLPPLGAAAWRTLLAAAAVALYAALRGEFGRLWPSASMRGRLFAMALLGGPLYLIGMNVAILLTGASITTFATGIYPLLAVAAAALLLRESLGRRVVLALGVAVALGAALSFALYLALARLWGSGERLPPLAIAFWVLVASVVVAGVLQGVLDASRLGLNLSPNGWVALLWLAVPASALPHVLVVSTLRRLPASRAAPFLLLMPIAGLLISGFLLGERLDQLQLVGAALILVGIGVATVRSRPVVAVPAPAD